MSEKLSVKSTLVERIYLCLSLLLFAWFIFFLGYTPYAHGPDLWWILFVLVCLCFFGFGVVLAFKAGRERKVMMGILFIVAVMAGSYIYVVSG